MQVCFLDAQDTAPSPTVNIHPEVDLLSLALVIQLASEYLQVLLDRHYKTNPN